MTRWSKTVTLFGVTLHCRELENGRRVIDKADVDRVLPLLDALAGHPLLDPADMAELRRWFLSVAV